MQKRSLSLSDGLVEFYSSQSELLLAQYETINRLLGPTTDWIHPGTHCEVLLRDYLRRTLLAGMSVDKGFIYGRVERDGKESHGPEIDILIHDTTDFSPIFRLDDFVIVQPDAVLGIIQVKRAFNDGIAGKPGSLAKGIKQVITAKQHLLDVVVQEKIDRQLVQYQGESPFVKRYPESPDFSRHTVFSAVVSFEDDTDKEIETYRQRLLEAYQQNHRFAYHESPYDTGVYVLPHFVGSLKHKCLYSAGNSVAERQYWVFDSMHERFHIGLQLFLMATTELIYQHKKNLPPFALPEKYKIAAVTQVPRPPESLHAASVKLIEEPEKT